MKWLLDLFGVEWIVRGLKWAFLLSVFFGTSAAIAAALGLLSDYFSDLTPIEVAGMEFPLVAMMNFVGMVDVISMLFGAYVAAGLINRIRGLVGNLI